MAGSRRRLLLPVLYKASMDTFHPRKPKFDIELQPRKSKDKNVVLLRDFSSHSENISLLDR
jgi:hypothetical protein